MLGRRVALARQSGASQRDYMTKSRDRLKVAKLPLASEIRRSAQATLYANARMMFGHEIVGKFLMLSPRTIRLLVVEDNPGYLYLIRQAFNARREQTFWELTFAKDGEEALHLLFEEEDENVPLPDFILLDWNLPGLSGAEVLRRTKQHKKLRRIPVLVFSSSEAEDASTRHTTTTQMAISPNLQARTPWRPSSKRLSASGSPSPSYPK